MRATSGSRPRPRPPRLQHGRLHQVRRQHVRQHQGLRQHFRLREGGRQHRLTARRSPTARSTTQRSPAVPSSSRKSSTAMSRPRPCRTGAAARSTARPLLEATPVDLAADACKKPDPGLYKHVLIRPHVLSLRGQSQNQRLAYPGVNKHHAVRPGTSLDPASQASSPRASPKILPPGARSRHQQAA